MKDILIKILEKKITKLGIDYNKFLALIKEKPAEIDVEKDIYNCVDKVIWSGVSGIVYRLNKKEHLYALKVLNPFKSSKGIKKAFLNEIKIRKNLKNYKIPGIVKTYAYSKDLYFIISQWIEGETVKWNTPYNGGLTPKRIYNILETLYKFELSGFFDWDINISNIIFKDENPWLFDFGYTQRFYPSKKFNPSKKNLKLFSMFQLFRDKFLIHYTTRLERMDREQLGRALYVYFCNIIPEFYYKKIKNLERIKAKKDIINYAITQQKYYENYSALYFDKYYIVDKYRSFKVNIDANLERKFYTEMFIVRCEYMINIIKNNYTLLKESDFLLFDDKNDSKPELIKKYSYYIEAAKPYIKSNRNYKY